MKTPVLIRILLLAAVAAALPGRAAPPDMNREAIFARQGFDAAWTRGLPRPGDARWLVIPGTDAGKRSVVLGELAFPEMPRRAFLSPRAPELHEYTFLSAFDYGADDAAARERWGLFFANIGENWALYLNGRCIARELHRGADGRITAYRHWREVLVPLDPRDLVTGRNIVAVHIVGDPTNIDAGFHRSTPFVIDHLDRLVERRSEQGALILICLYLFFGIYHLYIFAMRTSERYNFFYGAFSVMLFVYLFSRTHTVYAYIADSTVLHRIEYCSLYLLLPLFGAFADLLLAGALSRFSRGYALFCGALVVMTLLPLSNAFALDVLRIWQVTAPVPLVYNLFYRIARPFAARVALLYGRFAGQTLTVRTLRAAGRALVGTTAGNLVIGSLIMAGCAVFDILDSLFWSYEYVMTQYGFFVFTMGITFILANRSIAIYEGLERTTAIMQGELELAGQIQQTLLQPAPHGLRDWDVALSFMPKHGASGDVYDFYHAGDCLEGISLFDVSGHGVSSALITMIVKPITYRAFKALRGHDLGAVLARVNRLVTPEIDGVHAFISAILLRFAGRRVEYVNAGHPDLLHRASETRAVRIVGEETEFRGKPLGIDAEYGPPPTLRVQMKKGDVLLLFTDCILESQNGLLERFGAERLRAALAGAPDGRAEEVLVSVVRSFSDFVEGRAFHDDFTVIVVKRTT